MLYDDSGKLDDPVLAAVGAVLSLEGIEACVLTGVCVLSLIFTSPPSLLLLLPASPSLHRVLTLEPQGRLTIR